MKFGLCAPVESIRRVKALGFDYIEVNATRIGRMSSAEFETAAAMAKEASLPVSAANCLFPGEMNLYASPDRVAAWLQLVMPRLRRLGVDTVVFGSGGARRRPSSLPYPVAFRSLARSVRLMGDTAMANGLTVVIEPLNTGETDMINCLAEGSALAAMADHPNVRLLADAYHLAMEDENPMEMGRVGGVCHVHVALREGRRWPVRADEELKAFFAGLKSAGYDGRVSVEGASDAWEQDAPAALEVLRSMASA